MCRNSENLFLPQPCRTDLKTNVFSYFLTIATRIRIMIIYLKRFVSAILEKTTGFRNVFTVHEQTDFSSPVFRWPNTVGVVFCLSENQIFFCLQRISLFGKRKHFHCFFLILTHYKLISQRSFFKPSFMLNIRFFLLFRNKRKRVKYWITLV